jgi:peptidoglycan/xylan/chitin deacetylase (PgdA/CDA1 family)
VQRQTEPYITQVSVNLTAPQSVKLSWKGTPPSEPGTDSFTCSTGKGYSNPEDPQGTCNRSCCSGADVQCAPPHDEPDRRGACCTPIGNAFWTGTPRPEHNGWKFWTPVEPIHTAGKRGIALHQHNEVTGQAIGHGCIRMDEKNAERIFRYSRGKATNVTITGRAKVACPAERRCDASGQREPSGAAPTEAVALTRPDEENPGGGGGAAAPPELAELTVAAPGIVQRFGEPLVQRQQPQGTPPPEPVAQPPEAPKPPAAVPEGSKKVCLTFDDGPEPGTRDVLNTLRGRASATFFLTGKNLEKDEPEQAELVGRMLHEKHQIGNHTYSHFPETEPQYQETYGDLKDPAKLARFKQNFIKNREHFERILGDKLPDFPAVARLPGQGQLVRRSGQLIYVKAAQDMGMTHVTWHFEFAPNGVFPRLTPDWMGVVGLAAEWWGRKSKTDTPHQYPRPNDIVLLHDRHWAGKSDLLGAALTKLESGGFTFGKLDREGTCK